MSAPRRILPWLAAFGTAIDFLIWNRDILGDAPIVFMRAVDLAAPPNTTGVIGRLRFQGSDRHRLAVQPDTERVVVVAGASQTDRYDEAVARQQFKPFEGPSARSDRATSSSSRLPMTARAFDVALMRAKGTGLGLVSVTERVRLLGGTLGVVTESGKGTRVSIRIPANAPAPAVGVLESAAPSV